MDLASLTAEHADQAAVAADPPPAIDATADGARER